MRKNIQFRSCDDWVAMYVDGTLVLENHTLHWRHVLSALGIDFEDEEIDMPTDFSDETHYVEFAQRIEDIKVGRYAE